MKTQLRSSKPPSVPTIVGIAVATMVLSTAVMKTEASAATKISTRFCGAAADSNPSLTVSAGIGTEAITGQILFD